MSPLAQLAASIKAPGKPSPHSGVIIKEMKAVTEQLDWNWQLSESK